MPVPLKGTISGSRAGALLGCNPYQTRFGVWQDILEQIEPGFNEKAGYTYDPFDGNASTRFGHAFESASIAITERKIGAKITDQEKVFTAHHGVENDIMTELVSMSCHVDGLISDDTVYEGKTVYERGFHKWGEPSGNQIPEPYYLQVQHNMYLSGRSKAIVSCLVFPKSPDELEEMGWESYNSGSYCGLRKINKTENCSEKLGSIDLWARVLNQMGYHHLYYIDRDDAIIEKMLKRYDEFWTKHIIPRIPPEPENYADITRLIPRPYGTIILDNQDIIGFIEEYRGINKEIGAGGTLKKRQDTIKVEILKHVDKLLKVKDDESADKFLIKNTEGYTIATYSLQKDGKLVFRVSK